MAEFRGTTFVESPRKPVEETKAADKPQYKLKPSYKGVARSVKGIRNYVSNAIDDLYKIVGKSQYITTQTWPSTYSSVKTIPQRTAGYKSEKPYLKSSNSY